MKKYFDDDDLFAFGFSALLMFITHGFCFANLMYSHDSLYFYNIYYASKVDIGRWLYPLMLLFRNFATPWTMGMVSTVCVSLSVVLVVRLFNFNRLKSMCVAMLFSTNITLIALFATYSFDADADGLALLFSCFAVYAYDRFSGKMKIIVSIASVVLSLALYQAYISVSIGLILLVLIHKASSCENDNDVRDVVAMGVRALLILFSASVIYGIMTVAVSKLSGVAIGNNYNGPGRILETGIKKYLISIPMSYASFIKRMIWPDVRNSFMVIAATSVLFVITCIAIVLYIKKQKGCLGALKVIIPCLLIMPLGINAMYVVSAGMAHQLMIFSYCLIFFLPLIITDSVANHAENDGKTVGIIRKLYITAFVAITVIGINNIIFANGAYTYKKLVYDNTLLHAQKVWEDVNAVDGYVEGETPVVFIGEFKDSKAAYRNNIDDRFKDVLLGAESSSITYYDTIIRFYGGILGRGMLIENCEEEDNNDNKISDMPEYPSKGYCVLDGDRVIVKMSK